ncbi:MAG: HDIG domain-containing protein [Spirochaetes bacterium]|nr:HDIG domain-containing protein [Spirochaetota bacterium]
MKTDIDRPGLRSAKILTLVAFVKKFVAKWLNLAEYSRGPAIASFLLFVVTFFVIRTTRDVGIGIGDFANGISHLAPLVFSTAVELATTWLLLVFIHALFAFLRSEITLGRNLNNSESYLFSALVCFYLTVPILINSIFDIPEAFPISIVFPVALVVMVLAVFIGARAALVMAIALPVASYMLGTYNSFSFIIAVISGMAASVALQGAQKRMEIIRAGLVIAATNCLAVSVYLLLLRASIGVYPVLLFLAILNGVVSGMLLLGILPPLEQALNAITPFRLIELSDLNAPVFRKFFTTAPGTYSHSMMVATLAEQACTDIGANALLARVGAYYHDIGKMENPDYFIENQTDHNKHDDIAPRLSVTVIRSHVKLGTEKARSLKLPKAVIEIVQEHHGNSLVSFFYNKAVEQGESVNPEDFQYPGSPPKSRESAVVMLADVTEAAVRTLAKPTAAKIDKFIAGLFDAKVEEGQLAKSELTFRELKIIRGAFVKVLASYYHARIEYPNQENPAG